MTIAEFITKHEGRKNKPYKCPAGKNTIGVGWNFDDRPLPMDIKSYLLAHGIITDDMIDRLLDIAIKTATTDCEDLFPGFDQFSDNRRMALVDFLFNLGKRRAMGFKKAIAAINTGRWDDAAAEMKDSSWYRQVPNRAKKVIAMIKEG